MPVDAAHRHPSVFRDIATFIAKVPAKFSDAGKDALFRELIDWPAVQAEVTLLAAHLAPYEHDVVFCHNDLLCKNIIYDGDGDGVCETGLDRRAESRRGCVLHRL